MVVPGGAGPVVDGGTSGTGSEDPTGPAGAVDVGAGVDVGDPNGSHQGDDVPVAPVAPVAILVL